MKEFKKNKAIFLVGKRFKKNGMKIIITETNFYGR
jgi:hypothetical protein